MLNSTHISEALRIYKRAKHVQKHGINRYKGNAEEICSQIVKDCWNGRYFQVSTGHFCEFYIRDFGFCIDSLAKLGYQKEIRKTLEYALSIYSKQGLKTTITPKGKAVDIFMYSPDSLAYLIRSLRIAKALDLVNSHKEFLKKEIDRFYDLVIEKETGLVRSDRHFGSMKDEAKRRSSCYDNIMAAMLSNELGKLKLYNPLRRYDHKKIIKHMFWNGKYFIEEMRGDPTLITGDSNLFPFWSGVFDDEDMMVSALVEIQASGLDKPFPLKYVHKESPNQKLNLVSNLVKGYETSSVWMHMGPLYVSLLKQIDKKKAKFHKEQYKKLIEEHQNFLEVFDKDGKPFKSPFYYADEGMLWAANYLAL